MQHHGFESYYVLGEGLLATSGRGRTVAATADVAVPPFRFSRLGPGGNGKQLGEANRVRVGAGDDRPVVGVGSDPGGLHLPRPVHRPRPDVRQEHGHARHRRVPGRSWSQARSPSLDLDSLYGAGPRTRSRRSSTRRTACT